MKVSLTPFKRTNYNEQFYYLKTSYQSDLLIINNIDL